MRNTATVDSCVPRLSLALGAIVGTAAMLVGCSGGSATAPNPARAAQAFDGPLSAAEQSRIQAVRARVAAKLASGYVVKIAGTAASAVVRADGKSTIFMAPSNFVQISIVPKSEGGNRIVMTGGQR